jgi:hypothetical protein
MAFTSVLRELPRYPRALTAVGVLALAVGFLAMFRVGPGGIESRHYEVGYARAAAVVDTRPSQTVDALQAGGAIAELMNRAVLIADLMTRSPLREEIADRAGVPREELLTQRPMNLLEKRLTQREVVRTTVAEGEPEASILRVGVNPLLEGENPIIGIDVRAPDPARAARLADAAIAVIRDDLARTPSSDSAPKRPLEVRQLEPATAETASVGSSPILAILAAVGVLAVGCAATLAGARVREALRRRRRASSGPTTDRPMGATRK